MIHNESEKEKKQFIVEPTVIGAINSTLHNSNASLLMYSIVYLTYDMSRKHSGFTFSLKPNLFYKNLKRRDPMDQRYICLTKKQWMTSCGLSKRQYDKAMAFLKKAKSVEVIYEWLKGGGRKMLVSPRISFMAELQKYITETQIDPWGNNVLYQTTQMELSVSDQTTDRKVRQVGSRLPMQATHNQKERLNQKEKQSGVSSTAKYRSHGLLIKRIGEVEREYKFRKRIAQRKGVLEPFLFFKTPEQFQTFWSQAFDKHFNSHSLPWSGFEKKLAREILNTVKSTAVNKQLPAILKDAFEDWPDYSSAINDRAGFATTSDIIDIYTVSKNLQKIIDHYYVRQEQEHTQLELSKKTRLKRNTFDAMFGPD